MDVRIEHRAEGYLAQIYLTPEAIDGIVQDGYWAESVDGFQNLRKLLDAHPGDDELVRVQINRVSPET